MIDLIKTSLAVLFFSPLVIQPFGILLACCAYELCCVCSSRLRFQPREDISRTLGLMEISSSSSSLLSLHSTPKSESLSSSLLQPSPLWPITLTFHCRATLSSADIMQPSLSPCRLRRSVCRYNGLDCLKLSRQRGSEYRWTRLAMKARPCPIKLNTVGCISWYDFT